MSESDVTRLLPYGPDFLFVDAILSHTSDGEITTQKLFRQSDHILRSHFAGGPALVPGVILVEMVNQSALVWALLNGRLVSHSRLLVGSVKATFHRPAVADCTVTARVWVESPAGGFAFKGELRLGDEMVAKVHGIGLAARSPSDR